MRINRWQEKKDCLVPTVWETFEVSEEIHKIEIQSTRSMHRVIEFIGNESGKRLNLTLMPWRHFKQDAIADVEKIKNFRLNSF